MTKTSTISPDLRGLKLICAIVGLAILAGCDSSREAERKDVEAEMRAKTRFLFEAILLTRTFDLSNHNRRFELLSERNIEELLALVQIERDLNPVLPVWVETCSGLKVRVISQALIVGEQTIDYAFEYEFPEYKRYILLVYSWDKDGNSLVRTVRNESSEKPFGYLDNRANFNGQTIVSLGHL